MFVSRWRAAWVALLCAAGLAGGHAAYAQDEAPRRVVGLSLMISHVSPLPGPIDPSIAAIHRRILDEFHYQSLHVLERHSMELQLQQVGGVMLPTGKRVELRPLSVSPTGVLIAVDIPGTLQTDLRVPNRKAVVIGVDRYDDGKLILTLEPNY